MATLRDAVIEGLRSQGLTVEEEHGALVARGGTGDHRVAIRIDETDRVIRAEEILCYPVDELFPELCMTMDHLNQVHTGVTYAYQESQRALVATTVWTSPSRSPSMNQLHLLVALLHEAKERDADNLTQVVEGEASWEEVVGAGEEARVLRGTERYGEPSAPEVPSLSDNEWVEPPTRPMGSIGDESYAYRERDERPTIDLDREELEGRLEDAEETPVHRKRPPTRTSRIALQLAVQQAAPKDHDAQDLTTEQRGFGRRMFRAFVVVVACGGLCWVLLDYVLRPIVLPQVPNLMEVLFAESGEEEVLEEDEDRERRGSMQPGRELLTLELKRPLDGSVVRPCLAALGEKAREVIEDLTVDGDSEEMRVRAFDLWCKEGYRDIEGARIELLKRLSAVNRPLDKVVSHLTGDFRREHPADEAIIEALAWVKDRDVWRAFVERLGRPGAGAKARADALAKEAEHDSEDCLALRCLVETGRIVPDAVSRMVEKRGVEWAEEEGREFLVGLVRKQPDTVNDLLRAKKVDSRVLGVKLLAEAGTSQAATKLIKIMREPRRTMRVRLRAVIGLGKLGASEATWHLVLAMYRKGEKDAFRDEAAAALQKFPREKVIEILKEHLDPQKKTVERYYAVKGLGTLEVPSSVDVLVDVLQRDPDPRIRQTVVQMLHEHRRVESLQKSLNNHVGSFRNVAKTDSDAKVREAAAKLYQSITGRAP